MYLGTVPRQVRQDVEAVHTVSQRHPSIAPYLSCMVRMDGHGRIQGDFFFLLLYHNFEPEAQQ